MSRYYENLIETVLEKSYSHVWKLAVEEWEIIDCEEDACRENSCLCGKENLRYLFTIRNMENGNILYPVGSSCIRKFGRADLSDQTQVQEDMFRLLHAVEKDDFITLDSRYFSRKLIVKLYEQGAFPPNEFNFFNGKNDCQFLIDMFNKRDKTNITPSQHRKIRGLIGYSIRPFLQEKLKNKIINK